MLNEQMVVKFLFKWPMSGRMNDLGMPAHVAAPFCTCGIEPKNAHRSDQSSAAVLNYHQSLMWSCQIDQLEFSISMGSFHEDPTRKDGRMIYYPLLRTNTSELELLLVE